MWSVREILGTSVRGTLRKDTDSLVFLSFSKSGSAGGMFSTLLVIVTNPLQLTLIISWHDIISYHIISYHILIYYFTINDFLPFFLSSLLPSFFPSFFLLPLPYPPGCTTVVRRGPGASQGLEGVTSTPERLGQDLPLLGGIQKDMVMLYLTFLNICLPIIWSISTLISSWWGR